MRESCKYGSVRGAPSNGRPYRDRRRFISLLGGAAAWPVAARAQQANKLPTVGYLGTNVTDWIPRTAAFVGRLRELGWIDGRTISIEYRWTDGRPDRVAEIAAQLVQQKVDAIVTYGNAVAALKRATASIPIVFAMAVDPVGGGLVASLARPGGNVTGLSLQATDLAGKRLERLREVVPAIRRLAIIFNAGYPSAVLEMHDVQATARSLGLEVALLEIRRPEDIAPAFEALKAQADALYIAMDAFVEANRTSILTHATGARLPTMFDNRVHAKPAVSCPTDRASRTCFDAPPIMWTRFYAARNPAISRSSNPPGSSLSSISRLRKRSDYRSRSRFCPWPMR
jgi:putative ABC transport system substrate-binding protein